MATSRVQLTSEAKLRERIEKVGAYRVCAQTLAHSDTCHFVDFQDIKIKYFKKQYIDRMDYIILYIHEPHGDNTVLICVN